VTVRHIPANGTQAAAQSVAALQGVLQSGNYYVPIDEQMPEARMRRILAQVNDIPDELHLFFLLPEDGLSLLTRVCFEPYKDAFITSYGLSLVQEVLKDYQHVAAMALDFYFPGKRDLQETPPTTSQISLWIRESSYDASLKSSLYAFFFGARSGNGPAVAGTVR